MKSKLRLNNVSEVALSFILEKLVKFTLLMVVFAFPLSSVIAATQQNTEIAGRSVKIWMPGDGTFPLIIWSHGKNACADTSSNLSSALADEGFMVLAIDHADCIRPTFNPEKPFESPALWSEHTYDNRRDDWHSVLDELPNTVYASQITNLSYIGAVGHSLGGYTVLGLAGGWDSWSRPEIKVVALLSPYSTPYSVHNRIDFLQHDMIQFQGGSFDNGITPEVRDDFYPEVAPVKHYVEFKRATHFAWVNLSSKFDDSISYYLKNLFNAGLKGASKFPLRIKTRNVKKLEFNR